MRVYSENSLLLLVASRVCFFILEEYCKRKGKEYNLCGCEKTCDDPSGSCAGQCKEGCFCKRGKVLNTQGECEANSNCGCIYKGKKYKVSPIRPCYLPWGARMAQWWEHLPPTNVAWVQILRRSHMWLEFVVASLLCSESFLGELWFSPLFKNQHFQIPIRWDRSSGFNEFNMLKHVCC